MEQIDDLYFVVLFAFILLFAGAFTAHLKAKRDERKKHENNKRIMEHFRQNYKAGLKHH